MKIVKHAKYVCYTALLPSVPVCQGAPVAELATKKALKLEVAKRIAAASKGFAQKNKWNIVNSIVDKGGHLVYFECMDGVQTGSIQVAIRKAQTSAVFKRPTRLRLWTRLEDFPQGFDHCGLIRDGYDQTLTVDPNNLRFIFQGMWDKDKSGRG